MFQSLAVRLYLITQAESPSRLYSCFVFIAAPLHRVAPRIGAAYGLAASWTLAKDTIGVKKLIVDDLDAFENAAIVIDYRRANAPDVILTVGTATMSSLLRATRTVPIVFVAVADPVGAGFVKSLARPGGNVTGFIQFEYTLSGKWLELLKQIAPGVTRVAVLRDAAITSGIGQFAEIQSVAPSVGVEVSAVNVRDAGEIKGDIADFARTSNGRERLRRRRCCRPAPCP
jgi:hypothetical protein